MFLNRDEYVEIVGSLLYLYNEQFQCNEYDSEKWKAVTPERFPNIKKQLELRNSCLTKSDFLPTPNHKKKGLIFYQCPCHCFNNEIYTLIDLALIYEKYGPNAQIYIYKQEEISAKMFQAIGIVLSFLNELREKEHKKMLEQSKQKKSK